MYPRLFSILSIITVLLLAPKHSAAAFNYDPSLHWYTLTSEHFYIHFHNGEESIAREVADIAENVHIKISQFLNWNPASKTNIILNDRVDNSNGAATPIPDNRMYLYITPPDTINTLEDYNNWMELLITHEYTHIVHLDKATKIPRALRYIFGRFPILFPNALQPNWLIEGLATYLETDVRQGTGRGQSSIFSMMMRKEVEHGIKPISQINIPFATWPSGVSWYLYGVYYYQFIADTYGEEKIADMVTKHSNNLIPYMINLTSFQTFGANYNTMWPKFNRYLNAKFVPQLERIKTMGIKAGRRITTGGYDTQRAVALSNGDVLYYKDDFHSDAKLMRIDDKSKMHHVVADVQDGRFDAHLESGIVLAQSDAVRNTNIFMDLYHIDLKSGRKSRLTHGKRYKNVTWNPAGTQIIAVHNELGNSSMHLFQYANPNTPLENPTVIWQGNNKEVIGQLDWSPVANQLVAAIWRNDSGWNLELFNLDTREWHTLTRSDSIDAQPVFVQRGEAVVYSSDKGGVYNIHLIDLKSRQSKQLTNLTGGGFYPALNQDGSLLYYIGYEHDGYDLYELPMVADNPPSLARDRRMMDVQPKTLDSKTVNAFQSSESDKANEGKRHNLLSPTLDHGLSMTDYSPFRSLAPKWWSPSLFMTYYSKHFKLFGISTSGSDALNRHNINLDLHYISNLNRLGGTAYYVYDRWDPAFALLIQRHVLPLTNSENRSITGYNQYDNFVLETILPFFHFNWQFNIHAAASYYSDQELTIDSKKLPGNGTTETPIGLALTFNTAKKYPISISINNGYRLKLVIENSDLLKENYHGSVLTLDFRTFLPLGKQSVFATHLSTGLSTGGTRPFKLGGTSGQGPLDQVFNKRNYPLRGYGVSDNRTGTNMISGTMELRTPLARVERGTSAPIPIGIHQFYGTLFVDSGTAWDNQEPLGEIFSATGFELNTELILLYSALINVRVGFAKPVNKIPGQVYVNINTSF